jgi:predicted phosphodiesterase
MRVAALYDIHANLPALEAVLADVRRVGVDRIVVGGDIVPGPMPGETIACLQELELPVDYISGNGEREVREQMTSGTCRVPAAYHETMRWVAEALARDHERLFASWPATIASEIAGLGTVLFCHATPRNDSEIFTRLTPDDVLAPVFSGVAADLVVCGHTHVQFDRQVGATRVVNAGSVGMPFGEVWPLFTKTRRARRSPRAKLLRVLRVLRVLRDFVMECHRCAFNSSSSGRWSDAMATSGCRTTSQASIRSR